MAEAKDRSAVRARDCARVLRELVLKLAEHLPWKPATGGQHELLAMGGWCLLRGLRRR